MENEIEIAVLKANMNTVEKKVDSVLDKVDNITLLIQRQDIRDSKRGDEIKALNLEIATLKEQVQQIKSRAWFERTGSAVAGIILAGMVSVIVYFLTNGR